MATLMITIEVTGGMNDIRQIESFIIGDSKHTMTRDYHDNFVGKMYADDYAAMMTSLRNTPLQYPIKVTATDIDGTRITEIETVYDGVADAEYIRFNGRTVKTIQG